VLIVSPGYTGAEKRTPKLARLVESSIVNPSSSALAAGDAAQAQCYITAYQAVPPDFSLQPIFIGHYHDSFTLIDGNWHFTLRDISPDLAGDLSHHRADF
jgi:hypothetical protein